MRRIALCAIVAICAGTAGCGSAGAAPATKPASAQSGGKSGSGAASGSGSVSGTTVVATNGDAGKPKPPPSDADTDSSDSTDTSPDTVKTESPRDTLSAFLVKPAKQAVGKSQRPTAIVLYQALAVARGAGSAEARQLADLWRLVGGDEQAVAVLKAFIAASSDGAAVSEAQKSLATIKPDPYAKPIKLPSEDKLAKVAFKNGRAAFKKKKYGDALIDYQMGYALAPDLPGFLRELGATYDKLGAKDKKGAFYLAYLRRRPFGKNADGIRKELAGDHKRLGTLSVSASLPCTEVVIAAEDVPGKLPMKDIAMAPGDYVALCFNQKYAFGEFLDITITAGQKTDLVFNWAVVVNKLENPLGRIAIENANKAGQMVDLGVEQPELGVVVPDDGHALKVELRDDEGVKSEERYLKLEPGQTQTIKW